MYDHRLIAVLTAALLLSLAACNKTQAVETTTTPSPNAPALSEAATRGQAFAQAHCSACHAVEINRLSPVPEAPSFEAVVNTPGLTQQTLGTWLRDSHNYPEIMNFEVEPEHIEDLSAYMLKLKATR